MDALAYRWPGFAWEAAERRLEAAGGRGAVVGPQGHGKSTLLRAWLARRERLGDRVAHVRLAFGQRRLPSGPTPWSGLAQWVWVDSAEQLGRRGWEELLRSVAPEVRLVVTTHAPCRLPTVVECSTSPGLLEELVRELTGETIDGADLWRRHRGNIRLALRELYDARAEE